MKRIAILLAAALTGLQLSAQDPQGLSSRFSGTRILA